MKLEKKDFGKNCTTELIKINLFIWKLKYYIKALQKGL